MKIIITGGKGLLTSNIVPAFTPFHELIITDLAPGQWQDSRSSDAARPGLNRQDARVIAWDITDKQRGEEIVRQYKPDVIINFAAITDVDGCEDCIELANRVNGEAPGIVAEICKSYHVKFVHISTDYVFDGSKNSPYNEEDRPNPQSVYGSSKLSGEKHAMSRNPSSLIIRAQWLYGDGGENFITKITKIAKERGAVEVVDDQRGSPTYAKDLAYPLKTLIENGASGIYHIANSGSCTWFEFAGEIFSQLRMDIQTKPITSAALSRKAKRPAYSVYDCSKLQRHTGITVRSWQEALKEYLS